MSNYYISSCCSAQVSEIDPSIVIGRCQDCKEMCEIIAEEDDEMTLGSMDRF
jgi:hypothetical protein